MALRKRTVSRRSRCPLNIALELVGDAWSLLIVRDLMFKGRNSFNEFLEAEERIATNILSDRLAKLEANGLVEKRPHPEDARRFNYRLTERGIDLAPVLVDLMVWSARHEDTAAPAGQLDAMTRHRSKFLAQVRRNWEAGGQREDIASQARAGLRRPRP